MKKVFLILSLVFPFLLSACTTNQSGSKKKAKTSTGETTQISGSTSKGGSSTSNPTSSTSGGTSNTSGTSSSSSSEDIPPEDCPIISISLNKRELDVVKGNRSDSLTVNYNLVDPSDTSVDKDVNWSTSDSNIATVDQYGRVTGVNIGQTVVTATTVLGSRKASCVIYVVSSSGAYTIEWQKVTSEASLAPGDILVMGCYQEGKVATSENTGMYLHSVNSTFNSDGSKITTLNDAATQFILDGSDENWTLENEDGYYLATTNTSKVTFIYKTGNIYWDIYWRDGYCLMESNSNIEGLFMYNAQADRFTTYDVDSETTNLYAINLYRQVKIRN